MKHITAILFLLFSLGAFAGQNSYSFVTDFSLKDVKIVGSTAHIAVEHHKTYLPPRFELIPGQICLESFPPQCHATIVRLDDQIRGSEKVVSTFEVDLDELYVYGSPVIVKIIGPRGNLVIRY